MISITWEENKFNTEVVCGTTEHKYKIFVLEKVICASMNGKERIKMSSSYFKNVKPYRWEAISRRDSGW